MQVETAAQTFRREQPARRVSSTSTSPSQTTQDRTLKRVGALPPSRSKSDLPQLSVGQKVEHERFGIGFVENIEGDGDNAKASIKFEHAGTKLLLLRFARFKVIE